MFSAFQKKLIYLIKQKNLNLPISFFLTIVFYIFLSLLQKNLNHKKNLETFYFSKKNFENLSKIQVEFIYLYTLKFLDFNYQLSFRKKLLKSFKKINIKKYDKKLLELENLALNNDSFEIKNFFSNKIHQKNKFFLKTYKEKKIIICFSKNKSFDYKKFDYIITINKPYCIKTKKNIVYFNNLKTKKNIEFITSISKYCTVVLKEDVHLYKFEKNTRLKIKNINYLTKELNNYTFAKYNLLPIILIHLIISNVEKIIIKDFNLYFSNSKNVYEKNYRINKNIKQKLRNEFKIHDVSGNFLMINALKKISSSNIIGSIDSVVNLTPEKYIKGLTKFYH